MALVYKICATAGTIPEYVCDPCAEGEKGRVRSVMFIDKSLITELAAVEAPATKANIEIKAWIEEQIEAGLIIIIPNTRGTYDGGASSKVAGFGDAKEKVIGKIHTVVFNDPNHKENGEFYSSLEDNCKLYLLAFRTATELRVGSAAIETFEAKDAVEEDTESLVLWNGTAVWTQKGTGKTLAIYDATDILDVFNCIDTESGA